MLRHAWRVQKLRFALVRSVAIVLLAKNRLEGLCFHSLNPTMYCYEECQIHGFSRRRTDSGCLT